MMKLFHSPSLHLQGHCIDQEKLQMLSKVPHRFSDVFYSERVPSLSRNSQNRSTLLPFVENPTQELFNGHEFLSNKPVIDFSSLNKMIMECTESGKFEHAIGAYLVMLEYGLPVDGFRSFPCLIKAFAGLSALKQCRQIHGHVLKLGFLGDIYVVNALLAMYFKCGAVEDAIQMFERMRERDIVSWNSMISGFCLSGNYKGSLTILSKMVKGYDRYPNRVSCLSALSSCASIESLIHGREIHGFLIKSTLDIDEFLVSVLIEMYMKCADIKNAENVFKSIFNKESARGNAVIWNVMIMGYVSNECLLQALELFIEMLEWGIKPDSSTMVAVLVLCSKLCDLGIGKQIHRLVFRLGLENDIRIETALLDMYFKCGDPEAGLRIFRRSQNRNLVMWGAITLNCAQSNYPYEALKFFSNFMLQYGFPDSIMLLASLRACSSLALKSRGIEIHGLVVKTGFSSDIFVGGALVDMYGKCKDMESAQQVFLGLPSKDLVTWNALISAFSQNEYTDEAFRAFREMQSEQVRPNAVTASCILTVCACLSVRILCKEVHCYLIRQGFESTTLVCNSLISAYSKCGDIISACTVFEKMHERNEISWNSIILALGKHGHTDKMFTSFENMKEAGMKPDKATFTALLSACSHAGMVNMGWKIFKNMVEEFKLEPQVEHYTCMVDLLGRAGHLKQAYDVIMAMPCQPDDRIWGSLLGSCRSHGDEKLAEDVATQIFKLDPTSIGYRVLLSNLYEDSGKLNEVVKVRSEIKAMGLKKQPGCSWIEVNNSIHIFVAGDRSHHQSVEIYAAIESLTLEIERIR